MICWRALRRQRRSAPPSFRLLFENGFAVFL